MTPYAIALFAHVTGTLVMFMAIGVEVLCLHRLRSGTTTDQLRPWASLIRTIEKPFPLSAAAILLSGLYMVLTAWGWSAGWVALSLAAFVFMSVVGGAVNSRRLEAIATTAESTASGPIPPDLARRIQDPVLLTSIYALAALGFGIVFLKAAKPDLLGAVAVLAVAVALGVVAARRALRGGNAPSAPAADPAPVAN